MIWYLYRHIHYESTFMLNISIRLIFSKEIKFNLRPKTKLLSTITNLIFAHSNDKEILKTSLNTSQLVKDD